MISLWHLWETLVQVFYVRCLVRSTFRVFQEHLLPLFVSSHSLNFYRLPVSSYSHTWIIPLYLLSFFPIGHSLRPLFLFWERNFFGTLYWESPYFESFELHLYDFSFSRGFPLSYLLRLLLFPPSLLNCLMNKSFEFSTTFAPSGSNNSRGKGADRKSRETTQIGCNQIEKREIP